MPLATIGVTTGFTLAVGSNAIAAANSQRKYGLLMNLDSTRTVYLGFGTGNQATAALIPIAPGQEWYEKDPDVNMPKGDVAVYSAAAGVQIAWHEE